MTAGDAAAEDPRRPVDAHHEDDGIDVSHYARLLWQHRLLIVIVMIAGGAVGWAVARFTPPNYQGTARLLITEPPGAEAVTRFQAMLQTEAVLSAALKNLALDGPPANLTVPQVRPAISSRVGPPPNMLLVDVTWPTPGVAVRIARAVTPLALEAARVEAVKTAAARGSAASMEIQAVDRLVAEAQRALTELRQANALDLARVGPEAVAWRRLALFNAISEIPAERAGLKSVEEQLARVPATLSGSPNRVYVMLATQAAASRARLAGLEAKRDYLIAEGQPRRGSSAPGNEFEAKLVRLEANFARAVRVRDQLADAEFKTFKDSVLPQVGLQLLDEPDAPERVVGIRTSSSIARGLAMGLMLAVVGVIFLSGLPRPRIGRRA